ncbi:hypothetical protein PPYR_11698 [Photinus pyralis]|uniref:Glycolipid transfer protein domain-containing protein n=1 Tax=Photinus pyralis TaxID=7054 RepID=A0A5N4AC38_PHOPY|nr:uncharacterized protein LOC116177448 isoform X2 [Photinus pyralis]KAB0794859.1 hypothetical protein PPYR_11698 [Photinus pyralis]
MEYFGMDTYFRVFQRPFPHQTLFKIKTIDFIIPCRDFVHLLHEISMVFTLPRVTMQNHLEKVIDRYNENQDKFKFLEEMILTEQTDDNSPLITALLQLRRHLQFFLEYFEGICNDELLQEDTSIIAKFAYSNTLEPTHGWFLKLCYNLMICLFPKRTQFINKLGFSKENMQEFVLEDMHEFTFNLRCCANYLQHIYLVNGLEVLPRKKKMKIS